MFVFALLLTATSQFNVDQIDHPVSLAGGWTCDDAGCIVPLAARDGDREGLVMRAHVLVDAAHRGQRFGLSVGLPRGDFKVLIDGTEIGAGSARQIARTFAVPADALSDGRVDVEVRLSVDEAVAGATPGYSFLPDGPLLFGLEDTVRILAAHEVDRGQQSALASTLAFTALFLLVALYHGLIWLFRRQLKGHLWFAIMVLMAHGWISIVILAGTRFFPVSQVSALSVGNFIGTWVTLSLIEFIWHYLEGRAPTRAWRIYQALLVVVSLIGFVPTFGISLTVHPVVVVVKLVALPWSLVVIFKAARRKSAAAGSARVLFVGMAVAALGAPLEIFVERAGIELPVSPAQLALAGFVLTMAVALTIQFTRTLADLDVKNTELQSLNVSIARFVPFGFLRALGKDNVAEVARGDARAQEMAVVFCDIRGFTTLAEKLGPDETFAFLNRYLAAMEPAIQSGTGFINQYYGDGLMALFSSESAAKDALLCVGKMFDALARFNASEPGDDVEIGVGVHFGQVKLGTIGGHERLDSGVVGDVVNTAARLEGMTKIYGARALVSAELARAAGDQGILLREVDVVRAKGKREPLVVMEVLDVDVAAERKRAQLDDFKAARTLYRAGEFAAAASAFAVLDDDGAARALTLRCARFAKDPPEAFNGVYALQRK